jgi:hypothetical protein
MKKKQYYLLALPKKQHTGKAQAACAMIKHSCLQRKPSAPNDQKLLRACHRKKK